MVGKKYRKEKNIAISAMFFFPVLAYIINTKNRKE